MPLKSEPLTEWLRARRRTNGLRLEMMSQRYDLDGALAAGQWGLAWRAHENIVVAAIGLYLADCGYALPEGEEDRVDRAFRRLDALERANSTLGRRAWELFMRPVPDPDGVPGAVADGLAFAADGLGADSARSRARAVGAWADSTRALRDAATGIGSAASNDWYLPEGGGTDDDVPEDVPDWYADVLRVIGGIG